MKPTKNHKTQGIKPISTAEFDAKFDRGEDISEHLDLGKAEFFEAGEPDRLDLTPTKVNVDFPKWMVESLDQAADRLGVPRQSPIKMWLAERLERSTG
jgi:hypothetical protein